MNYFIVFVMVLLNGVNLKLGRYLWSFVLFVVFLNWLLVYFVWVCEWFNWIYLLYKMYFCGVKVDFILEVECFSDRVCDVCDVNFVFFIN